MLSGELDVMAAATVAATLYAIAAGGSVVIVDLAGLRFLAASGLAALMLARARAAGGELLLAAPQRQALLVLTAARLAVSCPSTPAWKMRPGSRNSRGQPPRSPLVRLCLR
jgi:anti-anti-sigma factor